MFLVIHLKAAHTLMVCLEWKCRMLFKVKPYPFWCWFIMVYPKFDAAHSKIWKVVFLTSKFQSHWNGQGKWAMPMFNQTSVPLWVLIAQESGQIAARQPREIGSQWSGVCCRDLVTESRESLMRWKSMDQTRSKPEKYHAFGKWKVQWKLACDRHQDVDTFWSMQKNQMSIAMFDPLAQEMKPIWDSKWGDRWFLGNMPNVLYNVWPPKDTQKKICEITSLIREHIPEQRLFQ